jgi:formylglycine-generating enzyme
MKFRAVSAVIAVLFIAAMVGSGRNAGEAAQGEGGGECPPGMAYIPPGEFMMGGAALEIQEAHESCKADGCDLKWFEAEGPQKLVKITKGFCMDETEVAQGAYQAAIGNNPSEFKECGKDCPVEGASWDEAKAYCEKAGKRLPTEAEWEYAARGATATKYYWGGEIDGRYANYCDKNCWYDWKDAGRDDGYGTTSPAGKYPPNAYGLYDMLGNAWEWVLDCYDESWYAKMPEQDPENNEPDCKKRVLRGGAWYSDAWSARASFRYWYSPGGWFDFRYGFRCARNF